MNTLRMMHNGFFEGQFLVTTDECAFTVGKEITVLRTGKPFDTKVKFDLPDGRVVPCWALPVDLLAPQKCPGLNIPISTGISGAHWNECLKEGVPSVVKLSKFTVRTHTGYVPNIDGWVPGLFGKRRAEDSRHLEATA